MSKQAIIVVLLLVVLVPGCGGDRDGYPASEPSTAQVSGGYRAVHEVGKAGDQSPMCILDLGSDGEFVMLDMPGWAPHGDFAIGATHSGKGQWEIVKGPKSGPRGAPYLVVLKFTSLDGHAVNYVCALPHLWGREPPWEIRIAVGDPDSGNVIVLQKIEGKRETGQDCSVENPNNQM